MHNNQNVQSNNDIIAEFKYVTTSACPATAYFTILMAISAVLLIGSIGVGITEGFTAKSLLLALILGSAILVFGIETMWRSADGVHVHKDRLLMRTALGTREAYFASAAYLYLPFFLRAEGPLLIVFNKHEAKNGLSRLKTFVWPKMKIYFSMLSDEDKKRLLALIAELSGCSDTDITSGRLIPSNKR